MLFADFESAMAEFQKGNARASGGDVIRQAKGHRDSNASYGFASEVRCRSKNLGFDQRHLEAS